MEFCGGLARLGNGQRRCDAERHAALLAAELVLENERSRSGLADAQAETGDFVVEMDRLGFAGRHLSLWHRARGEFHSLFPT